MNDRRKPDRAPGQARDRTVFNAALRLGSAVLFLAILAFWAILWFFASDWLDSPNFVLDALLPLLALLALFAVFKTRRTNLITAAHAERGEPPFAVRALGKTRDSRLFKGILWLGIVGFLAFALPAVALTWLFASIQLDGGSRERLPPALPLRDTLHPVKPQWTPDGAGIVFGHRGDIYAVNPNEASSLRLVYERGGELDIRSAPRMFRDGSRMAYMKYEHSRLVFFTRREWRAATAALDGADERVFNVDGRGFSWSPDGSRLAFIGRNGEGDEEMRLMDADGSNPRSLSLDGYPGRPVGLLAWSPDGGRIAFVIRHSPNRLYTVGADGSGLTVVSRGKLGEAMGSPAWSPDGSRIAFISATDAPDGDYPWEYPTLYSTRVASSDGSNLTTLHQAVNAREGIAREGVTLESAFTANEVSWSPDGAKLLVSVANSVSAVNADGSGSSALMNFPPNAAFKTTFPGEFNFSRNARASWSQDGSKIAVYSRGSEGALFTMSSDGSDKRVLARQGNPLRLASDQSWRPEYDAPTPTPIPTPNPTAASP